MSRNCRLARNAPTEPPLHVCALDLEIGVESCPVSAISAVIHLVSGFAGAHAYTEFIRGDLGLLAKIFFSWFAVWRVVRADLCVRKP